MSREPGVAGNHGTPELGGIWLVEDWDEAEYFASIAIGSGIEAVDVWEVSLGAGESLVEDDAGYWYLPTAVPADSVRLVRERWSPNPL